MHYTATGAEAVNSNICSYGAQLEAKGGIVGDALTRIARRPLPRVAVRPARLSGAIAAS